MRAVVKTRPGQGAVELRDVDAPRPGPGQVVLEVAAAGICGTDLHIMAGEFPCWPPVVLGHEFTGRVSAAGAGVPPDWLGQRVVCEPHAGACGHCYLCRRGCPQLCARKRSPGWGIDGAFASHVALPVTLLHRVPGGLPDAAAVLAEPMAVALSALERAPVRPGDVVVVTGPGPLGILAALGARFAGAGLVVVAGRPGGSAARLAAAARLGFTALTDPAGLRAAVLAASDDRGADLLIEASGSATALRTGLDLLRVRGAVAAVGLSGQPSIAVDWDLALRKSLDIALSMSSSPAAWDPALVVLGRYASEAASLVTTFPLGQWAEAFGAVEHRTVVKAALVPGGDVTGTQERVTPRRT